MYAYADKKQATTDKKKADASGRPLQMQTAAPNVTGIPDATKTQFESFSGFSFDDVRVHYNSSKPAQLHALAYTQGDQVHIAPGQEKHLGHELGHVVQQMQGRVQPTIRLQGVSVNNNEGLEREADGMSEKAAGATDNIHTNSSYRQSTTVSVLQRIAWPDKANGTVAVQGVPNINGVNDTGATTNINVAGYQFVGPMYSLANEINDAEDKIDLITKIASKVGAINYPQNDKFLTKNQLETNGIGQTIALANIGAMIPARRNIYRGAVDPFIIRAPGETADHKELALHYQFGRDSYGYIVKIEQEGKLYTMNASRGQTELVEAQIKALQKGNTEHELFEEFSSAHDTDEPDANISDTALQSTLAGELTLLPRSWKKDRRAEVVKLEEKSRRLDAVTKIGGEGARWQCVRHHALDGKLKNSSRFYTINYHNGNNGYIGITFQTLWGCWASVFDSEFDIDNDTVVNKLLSFYDDDDTRIILLTDDEINDADYSLN